MIKKFLIRKWHSIPVGLLSAILILCLLAGSVFAAYGVWSGGAHVTVQEALTIQVDGTDNSWIEGDGFRTVSNGWMFTIPDAHPGESAVIPTKVLSDSYADLTATMTYSVTGPTPGKVTVVSAWTAGDTVPARGETVHNINVNVAGDATPGEYTVTINFSRE